MGFMLEHNWPQPRNTHMSPFNHPPTSDVREAWKIVSHWFICPSFLFFSLYPCEYKMYMIRVTGYTEGTKWRKKKGLKESEFLWVCVGNPAELISVYIHSSRDPFDFFSQVTHRTLNRLSIALFALALVGIWPQQKQKRSVIDCGFFSVCPDSIDRANGQADMYSAPEGGEL
jgi:hypothetical protein